MTPCSLRGRADCVQPTNNFLAIQRASFAAAARQSQTPPRPRRRVDAARAIVAGIIAGSEEIVPDKISQGTGPGFFADPKGLERQVAGVAAAA